MKTRCYNKNHSKYEYYGGKGIKVCDRWLGSNGLINFLKDMGPRLSKELTLDRINNNRNYEPSNCRWATMTEQRANQKHNNQYTKGRINKGIKL